MLKFFRNAARNERAGRFDVGRVLLLGGLAVSIMLSGGCTRRFFRKRTDEQVDAIMKEKDKYPQWGLEQFHVYPDPRSRFADWTNPDRPPKPPDDPAAYLLSPNPQKAPKSGVQWIEGTGYLDIMAQWDKENRARKAAAETKPAEETIGDPTGNPEDLSPSQMAQQIDSQILRDILPEVEVGKALPEPTKPQPRPHPFMLNLEQTVELGFLNSREFQTIREQLYLAALPVTAERFSFAAQPFLTEQIVRQYAGRQATGVVGGGAGAAGAGAGAAASGTTGTTGTTGTGTTGTTGTGLRPTNNWVFNTSVGLTKQFATGALLLLNFANQTVYNLGSGNHLTSVSNVSLDIVQPFLAGGGWAVTLEPLTVVERNLLYAIRDFYRFRQEYFVFFAAGQPTFIPGVQPGVSAITTGTISPAGAFVPVATALPVVSGANPATPQVTPALGTPFLFPTQGFGPTPQGYLSTVGERAILVNYYKNIIALRRFLRRFQVYLEGGTVNAVQVGQVEVSLLQNISTVYTNQVSYRVSLDQLKQQLGLPITVPIDLDDTPLQPMISQTRRFEQLTADYDRAYNAADQFGKATPPDQVRRLLREMFLKAPLTRDTEFRKTIQRRWREWEAVPRGPAGAEYKPLEDRLNPLKAELARLITRKRLLRGETLPEAEQKRQLELEQLLDLGLFELALRTYEARPWLKEKDPALQVLRRRSIFQAVYRHFLALLEEPFTERLEKIRAAWPDLPQVCVNGVDLLSTDEDTVLATVAQAALTNRLDLMNQRAQVVDAWRKIAVAANALLGTFTVDYHLGASSPTSLARPFALGGSRTTNQLFLNMSPPLVRIIQRNDYRSTLINYQQLRRQLMLDEDNVVFQVRLDLRTLRQNANLYHRVQKRNIELAYRNVDQALQAFSQPLAPPGAIPLPGLVGPTAPAPVGGDPAALTQQLLGTQNSLVGAQNSLYTTWLGFLTTRMSLYRDLGIMPLDNRGVWIDDAAKCKCDTPDTTAQPGREQPADGRPGNLPEQLPQPRPVPPAEGPEVE